MSASSRGRNNRRKGASGEREVATILSESLGVTVKRILGQERDSGNDIEQGSFRFEVKRRKRVGQLYEWFDQVKPGKVPVVMLRADGREWIACMRITDWLRIAREELTP